MNTTQKILTISTALVAVGGLGIFYAYKRVQGKRRKSKELSIQIV